MKKSQCLSKWFVLWLLVYTMIHGNSVQDHTRQDIFIFVSIPIPVGVITIAMVIAIIIITTIAIAIAIVVIIMKTNQVEFQFSDSSLKEVPARIKLIHILAGNTFCPHVGIVVAVNIVFSCNTMRCVGTSPSKWTYKCWNNHTNRDSNILVAPLQLKHKFFLFFRFFTFAYYCKCVYMSVCLSVSPHMITSSGSCGCQSVVAFKPNATNKYLDTWMGKHAAKASEINATRHITDNYFVFFFLFFKFSFQKFKSFTQHRTKHEKKRQNSTLK